LSVAKRKKLCIAVGSEGEHFLGWRCVAGNGNEAASEQAFYTRELWRLKVDEGYGDISPTNMHQTAVNIQVSASIGIREKKVRRDWPHRVEY
jgi:hypothetical protein